MSQATESTTETTEVDNADATTETQEDEPQKGNREARYRVERNDARAERDALAGRVERMQRAEITRLAGEHLAVGEDLFVNGNDVASYLDEETGDIDADRVREDAQLLITERPRLGKNAPAFDPSQGSGGNVPKREPSWGALING